MSTVERLVKRLREDLDVEIPEDYEFVRLYPGHWQRSAGAWSWCLLDGNGRELFIGSQWPVAHLLKSPTLTMAAVTPYVPGGGIFPEGQ